jgi:hypothetical protein
MILPFALILSIMSSVGVFYGEDYHVVVVLDANPQQYISFVWTAILGSIPIAASVVFFAVALRRSNAYARLMKFLLIIVGVLCIIWGLMYVRASYISYYDIVDLAHNWPVNGIDSYLLMIYLTYGFTGGLWLLAGILLSLIHPLKKATTLPTPVQ